MRRRIDRVVAVAVLTSGIVGSARRRGARAGAVDQRAPAQARNLGVRLRRPGRARPRRGRPRARRGRPRAPPPTRTRRPAGRRSAPASSSTRDGYVVTNEHVMRGVSDLHIRLYDGRELHGLRRGRRPGHRHRAAQDHAQAAAAGAAARRLGRRARRRAGDRDRQPVRVQPQRDRRASSRRRSASSIGRRCASRTQQDIYSFFIQTDASINLGNSGGPLIDAGGAVIGVSAAFWAGHPLQPAQGIGFAIPINMAKALLPRLARDGQRARGRSWAWTRSRSTRPWRRRCG